MTRNARKQAVPLDQVRRYLESGPVVLVSSAWQDERDRPVAAARMTFLLGDA